MSEFTLEPAELAFLLTLVEAADIPGVNVAPLFPADERARDALLERGGRALAAHGYMTLEGRTFRDLHPMLPLAVATLAAPEAIIQTTAYVANGERRAAHYLSAELVVEFYILPDGNYRIVTVDSVETAIGRIAYNLGLAVDNGQSAWRYSIPSKALGGHEALLPRIAAALAAADDETTIAMQIADALRQPRRVAQIDLVRIVNGEPVMRHSVLLFDIAGTTGMLHYDPTAEATLSVPAAAEFMTGLRNGVLSLQELSPAI